MSETAEFYDLELVIEAELSSTSRALLEAVAHVRWPPPSNWRLDDESLRSDPLVPYLERHPIRTIEWFHRDMASVYGRVREGRTWLTLHALHTDPGVGRRVLGEIEEIVTRLLGAGVLVARATLEWNGSGLRCVPTLPQVGRATYLCAGTDDVLALGWDDVDAMIAAGGWDATQINGRRLLTRAMHAETNVELLEAIQDGQWAMARLSKARTCHYRLEDPEPEEVPIFSAGEPRVLAVGYDDAEQTAIYSCALDETQHVQPREIWTLGRALRDHVLPSGEPVRAIRVIFADRPSALRERRPLLDLGVTVQCYGPGGELETLPADQ